MTKENILGLFEKSDNKILSLEEIKRKFETTRGLNKLLDELVKEGILFKTKAKGFGLSSYYDYKVGEVISASKKGIVVKILETGNTYSLTEILSHGAIYQDKVLCTFNKYNCVVIDVINENNGPIVGEVVNGKHRQFIKPLNPNYPLIDINENAFNTVEGHIVSVTIFDRISYLKGRVEEIIGHKNDPDTKIKAIARDSKVNLKFNDEVMEEANSLSRVIPQEELDKRVDLTNHLIVTIDGIEAKDLDDAIEVEKLNDGTYKLGVHIADVSHYVNRYSKIDSEALKRGTSIYLVNFVIPMLPHILSNDLCSLNPNEIKLTMSCEMIIDMNGDVISYNICESYIKSKYRLNYDDVNSYFDGNKEYPKELSAMLDNALELSNILKKNKIARGEIDLDIKEPEIVIENNEVVDVKVRNRGKAERLIEDFMIAANETVASHIYYQDLPFIYRVHEEPSLSKFDNFNDMIGHFGYKLKARNDLIHPSIYQDLINRVDDNIKDIVRVLMLRSMSKAKYDINNYGHFGLASECYTHFTSPIRRYPDLLVHRLLKMYMHNDKYNYDNLVKDIAYMADLSSNNELKAIELERKIDDIKMAEYMAKHLGEIYEGKVISIIGSGLFVELDNLIEGMVKFESMMDDFYDFDETNYWAIGEKSRKIITLSDKILVKVESVDVEKGKIEFIAVDHMKGNKKNGKSYKSYRR